MRRILRAAAIASLAVTVPIACFESLTTDRAQSAQDTPFGHASPAVPLLGRVTDAAEIVPFSVEAGLSDKLEALERATGHQLVVVSVPSLGGRDIAAFTTELGNAWGIGRNDADNGVILLVAPNERRVRIAVGNGLERALPDDLCSQIIQDEILPHFRDGDLPGGIEAGAEAIIRHLQ